jgi:hypothetical protein
MSAFLKTLFGDLGTVSVVGIVMSSENLFASTGHVSSAVVFIPLLVLGGIAWLATR